MKIERFLYVYSGLHLLLLSGVLPLWVLIASGLLYLAGFVSLGLMIRWPIWLVQVLAGLGLAATFMWVRPVLGMENSASLAAWVLALQIHNLEKMRPRWTQMYVCLFALAIFLIDRNSTLSILVLFMDLIFFFGLLTVSGVNGASVGALSLKRSTRLVVLSLPIWVLLFVFFPRFTLNLWGGAPGEAHQTGFAEELRPGQVSRMVLRDEIVLRFRMVNSGYIASWGQQYYLRGGILNESHGLSWNAGKVAVFPQSRTGPWPEPEGGIKQEIWIEPRFGNNLFGIERMQNVQLLEGFDDSLLLAATGENFRLQAPLHRLGRYIVNSDLKVTAGHPATNEELEKALELPSEVRKDLQLVKDLPNLEGLKAQEAVRSLEQYFHSKAFRYTLNPPGISDGLLSSFMNDSKLGFCEHFAATTATVLRAAGIPARVVIGFLGGSLNPISQEFLVYDRDAHAWTEIYDRELERWIRYDPTAFIQPLRFEIGSMIYRMNESELRLAEVGRYAPGLLQSLRENMDLYWEAWGRQLQRRVLLYDGSWLPVFYQSLGLGRYGVWLSMLAIVLSVALLLPLMRIWMRPQETVTASEKLLLKVRRKLLPDFNREMGETELLHAIEKNLRSRVAESSSSEKYILELRSWFAGFLRLRYAALSKDQAATELAHLRRDWARLKRQIPTQDSPQPRSIDSHVN